MFYNFKSSIALTLTILLSACASIEPEQTMTLQTYIQKDIKNDFLHKNFSNDGKENIKEQVKKALNEAAGLKPNTTYFFYDSSLLTNCDEFTEVKISERKNIRQTEQDLTFKTKNGFNECIQKTTQDNELTQDELELLLIKKNYIIEKNDIEHKEIMSEMKSDGKITYNEVIKYSEFLQKKQNQKKEKDYKKIYESLG